MPGIQCPECMKLGQQSSANRLSSTKTSKYVFPFFDSSGKEHMHDTNVVTNMYACSLGHRWTDRDVTSCQCGWPSAKERDLIFRGKSV